MKNPTQNERIWMWLSSGRSITQRMAYEYFGCTRLAARIADLRKELPLGYAIVTEMVTEKNRHGVPTTFAKYKLIEQEEV